MIITDKLASYAAAKRELLPGVEHRQHPAAVGVLGEDQREPTARAGHSRVGRDRVVQWRGTCSQLAQVTVREKGVVGSTQTSLSSACHKDSTSRLRSLALAGSSSECKMRLPPVASTNSISVSVRMPMLVCGFMMGIGLFLLVIRSMCAGMSSSAHAPVCLSSPTACETAHGSTHSGAHVCQEEMSSGQSTPCLGMLVVPEALQMRSSQL